MCGWGWFSSCFSFFFCGLWWLHMCWVCFSLFFCGLCSCGSFFCQKRFCLLLFFSSWVVWAEVAPRLGMFAMVPVVRGLGRLARQCPSMVPGEEIAQFAILLRTLAEIGAAWKRATCSCAAVVFVFSHWGSLCTSGCLGGWLPRNQKLQPKWRWDM